VLALEEFHPSSVRPAVSRLRHDQVQSQARPLPNLRVRSIPSKIQASRSTLLVFWKIRQRSRHGANPAENPDPSINRRTMQTAQQPTLMLPKSREPASPEIQMRLLFNGEERTALQMLPLLPTSRQLPARRGSHKPLLNHHQIFRFPLPLPPPSNRPKKAKMKIFKDLSSLSSQTLLRLHLHNNPNHNNQFALVAKIMTPFDLTTILLEKPSSLIIRTATLKVHQVTLTP
jgi:hypothetical protein